MVARVGSPVDAAAVAAFNEQHNSAAQRAWMAELVAHWAATQPADAQPLAVPLAVELVSGCRWLVRSSNADLVLPLAPKSPALQELCVEADSDSECASMTREAVLQSTRNNGNEISEAARMQVYAAVYEFPAEKVAAKLRPGHAESGVEGGTGAVLLLESLRLRLPHSGWPVLERTCLPSGLDVAGSLIMRNCGFPGALPYRVGWDLDASHCDFVSVALGDVGGYISLEHCVYLTSMAECQLTEVHGPLNLEGCRSLVKLPPKLAKVGGYLDLESCSKLEHLPDPLVVEGYLELQGCLGLGTTLGAGLSARDISFHATLVCELPSSFVIRGDIDCGAALTHLPKDLTVVDGDINIEAGSQLRCLPAGLRQVRGDLELKRPFLKELPPELHVHGNLEWEGDADRLPASLRVDANLELAGHPRLTELPDDLVVGRRLVLDHLVGLRRLSSSVRVVHGHVSLAGCGSLEELPEGFEVHGNLNLENCVALKRLPHGLEVDSYLNVSGCTSLELLPEDMVVKGGITHEGCTSLQWCKLLDWRDPKDPARSLDSQLPAIFGFLRHATVRGCCARVCSTWAAAAQQASPCCLHGTRHDFVDRLVGEVACGEHEEWSQFHCVPTAQWQCDPNVRVGRLWTEDLRSASGSDYMDPAAGPVRAQAVATEQAAFLGPVGRPLATLTVGDVIAPVDFGSPMLGGSGTATVTAVDIEAGEVALDASFLPSILPSGEVIEWECFTEWPDCTLVAQKHAALWEEAQNQPVQEGVSFADGDVRPELLQRLQAGIDALAESRPADYHPNSGDIVRNHVHPALYPFIFGKSAFAPSADLGEALAPRAVAGLGEPATWNWQDVRAKPYGGADKWGRPYEDSAYQWLPTYFDVGAGARTVSIRGDINNLRPRAEHEPLYGALAELFRGFLPLVEVARAYADEIDLTGSESDVQDEDERMNGSHLELPPRGSRRPEALQVITKIVDYELQPGQTYDGVWHVEGMSHEHILCTCLCVLDRGANIDGGELKFKRALTSDEADTAFEAVGQCTDSETRRIFAEGLVPLGKVATPAGRKIVFPNSHVHRLSKLENTGSTPERRRIVAFFVVDPKARIVSTQECPDQTPTMTREQALQHRLDLMEERRLHKQDWNVRDINLCEH